MRLPDVLLLATLLFSIGLYGAVTRRHAVALLLSIELMANAANVAFVALRLSEGAQAKPSSSSRSSSSSRKSPWASPW